MDGITLVIMTDGRKQYLTRTIDSLYQLHTFFSQKIIHDDSGDPEFSAWLRRTFLEFEIYSTGQKSGFAGAYNSAWNYLRNNCINDWIFFTEDDFVFTRPVNIYTMIEVMENNPHIAQMALRRQPWNDQERAAGGIVEQYPNDYTDRTDGKFNWLEHRRFFTTNPSLLRMSLIDERDWPNVPNSEGMFSIDLFSGTNLVSAFWGARDSGEWVEHIGVNRTGTGY